MFTIQLDLKQGLLICIKTLLSFLILPIIHLFLDLYLLRKSHFLKAGWYSVRRMPLLLFYRRLWLRLRLQRVLVVVYSPLHFELLAQRITADVSRQSVLRLPCLACFLWFCAGRECLRFRWGFHVQWRRRRHKYLWRRRNLRFVNRWRRWHLGIRLRWRWCVR